MGPAPLRPCFLTDRNNLNILGRESSKEHLCEIINKSGQWFLTRRFLKSAIEPYKEKGSHPLAAMFFDESK